MIMNNKTISISQVSILIPKFPLHLLLWFSNKLPLLILQWSDPTLANVLDNISKQKSLTLCSVQHKWANYLKHERGFNYDSITFTTLKY